MKKIYSCLWFTDNAKDGATYYCSIFKDSKIISENPMVVIFELNGTRFMALNGRQDTAFIDSVSFVIECDTQEEIDHYWNKLTTGGEESMCGWLKDKFGISWQVVPSVLGKLMSDPGRSQRVINAFLKMKKFNIAELD
jgi:predicted 3-demethylubiquinone-9 3-methyltransferase (glyoxalase superfamily)